MKSIHGFCNSGFLADVTFSAFSSTKQWQFSCPFMEIKAEKEETTRSHDLISKTAFPGQLYVLQWPPLGVSTGGGRGRS